MNTEHAQSVLSGDPDAIKVSGAGTHPATASTGSSTEPILQYFEYAHLPEHLRDVSRPFGDLAAVIIGTLPRNPERTVALRKLLESKDAAVRAKIAR